MYLIVIANVQMTKTLALAMGDIDRRVCKSADRKLQRYTNEGQAPKILKGENNDIQGNST